MSLPARFPGRRLLKVISLLLGALVFGLLAACVGLAMGREDTSALGIVLVAVPATVLPGFFVLRMILDSFSVLEVDDRGVRVRKWIGGTDLEWARIGSVRYWEVIQHVHGESREYFAELRTPEGKRLIRLKSNYEREAFAFLIEQARARNLRIDQ